MSISERGLANGIRGSPPRLLHNAVFDAMVRGKSGAINIGAGAGMYGFVGSWVPRGLVAWMMGVRRVDRSSGAGVLRSEGSGSNSENGSEEGAGMRESQHSDGEYVSVYQ